MWQRWGKLVNKETKGWRWEDRQMYRAELGMAEGKKSLQPGCLCRTQADASKVWQLLSLALQWHIYQIKHCVGVPNTRNDQINENYHFEGGSSGKHSFICVTYLTQEICTVGRHCREASGRHGSWQQGPPDWQTYWKDELRCLLWCCRNLFS